MSETIWRATDADGVCFDYYNGKPSWDGDDFGIGYGNAFNRYHGPNPPPPGECWEMTVTRKGEQPSGEAWERLVEACREWRDLVVCNRDNLHPSIAKIFDAYAAYEAAKPNEPKRPTCGTTAQQATIELLTKERDEALRELANERARIGQVTTEQINVIAELRDKLERPEMPEVVRSLIGDIIREVPGRFTEAIAAVEAHYAPPFKVDKPGWYLASDGKEWRVAEIDGDTAWGRNGFVWYGFSTKRVASSLLQLTKFLRPLEG